ncbi:MAG: hypothetical protein ACREFK_04760 [Stellaceae bacterium]
MLGSKKNLSPAPLTTPTTRVHPAADMQSDLGLFGALRVKRAERAAKTDAAAKHARRAVEISADVAGAQLELDATILKSALVARAAPVVGSILTELVARAGQVTLQLGAVQGEGMFRTIELRQALYDEIERRRAAGQLNDEEAEGARGWASVLAQKLCGQLEKSGEAAFAAVDGHVARATDHVRNSKLG